MNNTVKAAFFVTAIMMMACVVITIADDDAVVAETFDTGEFSGAYYNISVGTTNLSFATIEEYKGTDSDVNIPANVTIEDTVYPVTSLMDGIFRESTVTIESVTIPSYNSLTVSKGAFEGVSGAVFNVSDGNLNTILFQIVESVGPNNEIIFTDDDPNVSYSLDDGWLLDQGSTLVYVSGWAEGDIPECVTSINNTIAQDTENKSYSVTYQNCIKTSLTIPAGMSAIPNGAFYYFTTLESVKFADGSALTSIGIQAFSFTGLTSIDIPDSVISIGDGAFESCPLESIDLPINLGELSETAFINCSSIETFTMDGSEESSNAKYAVENNAIYREDSNGKSLLIVAQAMEGEFTVAEGTTSINTYAFQNSSLESVSIPETVTALANDSFEGSEALKVIDAPGVTSVGGNTLEGCPSLESIVVAQDCDLNDVNMEDTSLITVTKGDVTYPVKNSQVSDEPLSWYVPIGQGDLKPIEDVDDLLEFAEIVNSGMDDFAGKTVTLDSGLDLSSISSWTPIGNGVRSSGQTSGNCFSGVFDGNGNTISSLKIDYSNGSEGFNANSAIGLFGIVSGNGAEVRNLNLSGVSIESDAENNGAVVGILSEGAAVSDVDVVSGSISGSEGTGGVVGRILKQGTVENCDNRATISATGTNIGGIVGAAYYNNEGIYITECNNYDDVSSTATGVGGIVGLSSGYTSGCNNFGNVEGTGSVGGIVGEQRHSGYIKDCCNGSVDDKDHRVTNTTGNYGTGGIVGWVRYVDQGTNYPDQNMIEVSGCENHGVVGYSGNISSDKTETGLGGIVGVAYHSILVEGCINNADLSGEVFVAGIIGAMQTTDDNHCNTDGCRLVLVDNTNTGEITGTNSYGPIIGHFSSKADSSGQSCTIPGGSNWTVYGNRIVGTDGSEVDYEVPGIETSLTITKTDENGNEVVYGYPTMSDAVAAAEDGDTITLLKDISEDIVITAGKDVTLDLGTCTITNVSGDTITVEDGASLTITGSGTVDNITHAKAAILNKGSVTIEGGNFTRSEEVRIMAAGDKNTNSWYLVVNEGDMTITGGEFRTGTGTSYGNISSLIRNGTGSGTDAVLTITSGTFTNAANVIKNEADGTIKSITGGEFIMDNTEAGPEGGNNIIQNYGSVVAITGGEFKAVGGTVAPSHPTNYRFGISNVSSGSIGEIGGTTVISMEGTQRSVAMTFQSSSTTEVRITGGTFEIVGTPEDAGYENYVFRQKTAAPVSIEGGEFTGDFLVTEDAGNGLKITKGSFTDDVRDYLAEGSSLVPGADGGFVVVGGDSVEIDSDGSYVMVGGDNTLVSNGVYNVEITYEGSVADVTVQGTTENGLVSIIVLEVLNPHFSDLGAAYAILVQYEALTPSSATVTVKLPLGAYEVLTGCTVMYHDADTDESGTLDAADVTFSADGTVTFVTTHSTEYDFITTVESSGQTMPPWGWDDDDDYVPPIVPSQTEDSGDDNTTTIVACAAAAVVAALLAAFLIIDRRQ